MDNLIIIALLLLIIGFAVLYIYKAKKNGRKCIGCPYCSECNSKKDKNSGYCSNNSKT